MRMTGRLARIVGAGALALAGVIGLGAPAHASTSGQQIMFVDNAGFGSGYYLNIVGANQNGQTANACIPLQGYKTALSGWWWQGNVYIGIRADASCSSNYVPFSATYNVPAQSSGDWFAAIDWDSSASRSTQQLEFFDNQHQANSVYVSGTNQNGASVGNCWATPNWDNTFDNWWWFGAVSFNTYSSSDCSGSPNGTYTDDVRDSASTYQSWFGIND